MEIEHLIKAFLSLIQFLFVLLTTALVGNVMANNISGSQSAINFVMFVCAVSWLFVLYDHASRFFPRVAIPIVILVLDSLATLFTFIAAIVFSAKIQAVNCSNIGNKPSDYIAYGSEDNEKRCREIQASTVFLWFLFAAFAASLFFNIREIRRHNGSIRGPNMSQIGV
ncbi:marvel domain-containing protein [Daldinia vernicosa]|uniref:marvel domain-containing protein n=1 Tax=Daldinia vernicosa TaxID=114800 RepID=UPI0020075212|nr:marvel domain-containing protein [Daldinia vernicosa]KAI0853115.1 marvel domain-containing protein [Daldinia vernicosa]